MTIKPNPLRPDRLRTIEKPFSWIPFRLLTQGLFATLSDRAKLLYFFLCLVADRQGLSFYGDTKIQSYFQLDPTELGLARQELIHKDMIAYDGRLYQVLSLPSLPSANDHPRITEPVIRHRTGEPERIADILKRLASKNR